MKDGKASTTGGSADRDIGFVVMLLTVGAGMPNSKVGLDGTGCGTGRKDHQGSDFATVQFLAMAQ